MTSSGSEQSSVDHDLDSDFQIRTELKTEPMTEPKTEPKTEPSSLEKIAKLSLQRKCLNRLESQNAAKIQKN